MTTVGMLKTYYKWIGALLLGVFFLCGEAYGQSMRTSDLGRGQLDPLTGQAPNSLLGSNPFENPDEEGEGVNPADTIPKKPRKPLESWFFTDSVRGQNNFAWTLDMFGNNVRMTVIDTTLVDFQIDYPFQRVGVGDAYQGNLGGGSVPLDYHLRPNFQDFSFTQPYYSYIYTPENAPHYNVKKPYTRLNFFTAGQKSEAEENFSVIHAQNIAPSSGFNITYQTVGTRGIYMNQRTKNTKFSAAIYHTGKRYSGHAGYIFNTLDMRDNGGVVDDWHITGTIYERARAIPVWLTANVNNAQGARNLISNNTFYTIHTYGVPLRRLTVDDFSMRDVPAFYLGYAFQYDRWHRRYTDLREYAGIKYVNPEEPQEHFPTREYYADWFINPVQTRDSIAETRLSNRVFLQLQPWDRDGIIGTIDAGIGADIHQYYMFHPDDYLTGSNGRQNFTRYYVYGSVDGKFRRYFDWNGKLNLVPFGYRQGDLDAEANARLSVYLRDQPVSLSGRFSFRRSDAPYWSENYYSNHYIWSNSFDKENETRLEARLSIPSWNLEAAVFQSVVGNKIYYGQDFMPAQYSDAVSVTGVYARKDFRIGGLHLNNRVLLQWSTNHNVVPVPMVSVYLSWSYQFDLVRNVLRAQIGLDGRYNTRYYAYGFNPGVGQFYNQRERELGGYPWVDVFLNFKWKRMRIYLKLEHASEDLFGSRDYFMILHYPQNQRVFKLGLSWSFYD